jgi:hypothetical protein
MVSFLKCVVPAVAVLGLVFGISASTARAADEKAAGGTVTGTIVDKDGKAVEGAKIRVMKPMQRGQGGPGQGGGGRRPGGAQAQAADDAPAPAPGGGQGGAGRGGAGRGGPPVAEGTSDKDGKFSIANVPAGEYMVIAAVEGKGFARGRVTVKVGESASVELKLQDRPAGQGQGGPGGGQGGQRGRRPAQ